MKKFKALITFAAGDNSFFPNGEINEAPAELVEAWAKAGYADPIEDEVKEPKLTKAKKGAVK
jgi:hypothetical protein